MAANIAAAGHPLILYNRTRERAEEVAAQVGAEVADTPAGLAGADVVITMLADGPAIESVYEQGLLEALRPGTVCIDMSTIAPSLARSLASQVEARGCTFLDAPVSGSIALAEGGTLTIMVGGDGPALDRVRPILESMGSRVFHMGGSGTGATIKLAVNSIIYGLSQALCEGLVLSERSGIEREVAYEVFASSAIAAPFVSYRREAFERPGEIPVALRLVLAIKDLNLALALGEEVDLPMQQAELNRDVLSDAAAAGFGDHDMSAVAEYLRAVDGGGGS
jgi:3-hydroxyisobutyrate dehydrogenase-like beta-hydroxyacid dehydrogenase